jgi:precorrin-3B methylase
MDTLINLLSAFGLSGSAGLNAYLPLLVVSLTARFTNLITLQSPWDVLESWWVIGALSVLLVIEFFADKSPAINHVNDAIQTLVRPTAGAIVFAASTGVANIHPVLAVILGLLIAGGVHAAKSVVVRPAVTATTGGAANPVVSLMEDITALTVSVLAAVLPVLFAAIIVLLTALVVFWLYRRATRPSRAASAG